MNSDYNSNVTIKKLYLGITQATESIE